MAAKKSEDYYKHEGTGFVNAADPNAIDEARKRHHLASADPEPERDGTMTGPSHEFKYGLERVEQSVAAWIGVGVHPYQNRALVGDEVGAENLRGAAGGPDEGSPAAIETSTAPNAPENASLPRPE